MNSHDRVYYLFGAVEKGMKKPVGFCTFSSGQKNNPNGSKEFKPGKGLDKRKQKQESPAEGPEDKDDLSMEEKGKDLLSTQGCSARTVALRDNMTDCYTIMSVTKNKEQLFTVTLNHKLTSWGTVPCSCAGLPVSACLVAWVYNLKHYRSAGCQKVSEERTWELWSSESDSEENGRCVLQCRKMLPNAWEEKTKTDY